MVSGEIGGVRLYRFPIIAFSSTFQLLEDCCFRVSALVFLLSTHLVSTKNGTLIVLTSSWCQGMLCVMLVALPAHLSYYFT